MCIRFASYLHQKSVNLWILLKNSTSTKMKYCLVGLFEKGAFLTTLHIHTYLKFLIIFCFHKNINDLFKSVLEKLEYCYISVSYLELWIDILMACLEIWYFGILGQTFTHICFSQSWINIFKKVVCISVYFFARCCFLFFTSILDKVDIDR